MNMALFRAIIIVVAVASIPAQTVAHNRGDNVDSIPAIHGFVIGEKAGEVENALRELGFSSGTTAVSDKLGLWFRPEFVSMAQDCTRSVEETIRVALDSTNPIYLIFCHSYFFRGAENLRLSYRLAREGYVVHSIISVDRSDKQSRKVEWSSLLARYGAPAGHIDVGGRTGFQYFGSGMDGTVNEYRVFENDIETVRMIAGNEDDAPQSARTLADLLCAKHSGKTCR